MESLCSNRCTYIPHVYIHIYGNVAELLLQNVSVLLHKTSWILYSVHVHKHLTQTCISGERIAEFNRGSWSFCSIWLWKKKLFNSNIFLSLLLIYYFIIYLIPVTEKHLHCYLIPLQIGLWKCFQGLWSAKKSFHSIHISSFFMVLTIQDKAL